LSRSFRNSFFGRRSALFFLSGRTPIFSGGLRELALSRASLHDSSDDITFEPCFFPFPARPLAGRIPLFFPPGEEGRFSPGNSFSLLIWAVLPGELFCFWAFSPKRGFVLGRRPSLLVVRGHVSAPHFSFPRIIASWSG